MSTIQVPVVDEYYESSNSTTGTSTNNMENGNELMLRCLTVYDASSTLFICGILSLVVVLYHGTKYEGKPLQNLGKRQYGYGLWTWLCNYFRTGSVYGYDPILGSFNPIWRLLAHVASILILWGGAITFLIPSFLLQSFNNILFYQLRQQQQQQQLPTLSVNNSTSFRCGIIQSNPPVPTVVLLIGLITIVLYLSWFYYLYHIETNAVSNPGPPRRHKIDRSPKWNNRTIPFPTTGTGTSIGTSINNTNRNYQPRWKYIQSHLSHIVTEHIFRGTAGCLTGEPSGRDTWTTTTVADSAATTNVAAAAAAAIATTTTSSKAVDEKLVQLLASGGRYYTNDDSKDTILLGFNPSINPNSADIVLRQQLIRNYLATGKNTAPDTKTTPTTLDESMKKAIHFYSMLLTDDGHWTGDYGGPHFLLPGLVIAWYIMGKPISVFNTDAVDLIKHYITVHQQIDGGWGTHIESPSTMFGTTLLYVAIRLLGADVNDPICINGRKFLHANGGSLLTSSWAKFYLCLLGLMDWSGHNSVPAEMWLLPNWFPFHPCRMWCHSRMVYLPMGYLYGTRFVYPNADHDLLIQQLRTEIYLPNQLYDTIDWDSTRHLVAPMDNYSPIPYTMAFIQNILAKYESLTLIQPIKNYIRKFGLDFSIRYIAAEDLQTNYICIGPVNKVLNMLSQYHACDYDIAHPIVTNHLMRIADYMWIAEDGMKMKGYNGSQCWDTSFSIQAIAEARMLDDFPTVSAAVWNYLERTQILSTDVSQATVAYQYESPSFRKLFYRHVSEGGWPFSTSAHGWPISDCSGEGLKSVLCLLQSETVQKGMRNGTLRVIDDGRLLKCINVLLSYQNEDGGFATYENTRGFGWYEKLNPSEVFGDIMIDYSYVECTMASLTALADYQEHFPNNPRSDEIVHALDKGRIFLKSIQRPDGSWYGNWACCFTYGCWFGVEGLVKCGELPTSDYIQRTCTFLASKQRPNGGWGEDFTSCFDKSYAINGMEAYGDECGSGVVNTAWALLALAAANFDDISRIQQGVQYLMKRQLPSGDWPQEGISGVFNRACGITYCNYRNIFPIWALARCRAVYGADLLMHSLTAKDDTNATITKKDN